MSDYGEDQVDAGADVLFGNRGTGEGLQEEERAQKVQNGDEQVQ